jgi:hypothetical protein
VPTSTDGYINIEVTNDARGDENCRPEAYVVPGPVENFYQSGRNAMEHVDETLRIMPVRTFERVVSAVDAIATGVQTAGVVYLAASGNVAAMGQVAGLVGGALRRVRGESNLKQYRQVTGEVKNVVERREKKESKKMAKLLTQSLQTINLEDGNMFDVDLDGDADDEDEGDDNEWEIYDFDDDY